METSETRLDLIVLADLGSPTGRAHPLDKDGLDALLETLAPSADLGGVPLSFRAFRDFRPERIAQALPASAAFLRLRTQALEAAAGQRTIDELRAALRSTPDLARALEQGLSPAPAPRPVRAPDPKGGLFDLVDAEGSAAPPPPAAGLDALIGELLGPGASIPGPALRAVAAKAEEAAARVVAAAFAHPRVRALESAWRGLRWLLRSVDVRAGCRMHVVSCAGAARALREIGAPLAEKLRSQGGVPMFVVDGPVASPEAALALAEAAGGAPVVAGWEAPEAPGEAWVAVRKEASTRSLALAEGRFLLRPPYGTRGDRVKDFAFEEAGPALLGCASWVVGALAAGSFARTGWAADFTGASAAEGLEPLPLQAVGDVETPLERDRREPEARALGEAGILALACRRNSDRPFAATGAALHEGASWRAALFAAQVGTWVERLRSRLDPAAEPEAVARTLAAGIELLAMGEGGPALKAEAAAGGASIRLRPLGGALRGLPELEVALPKGQ